MSKKIRNIIIVLGILIICIVAYAIILNITKKDEQNNENGTSAYYLDLGDYSITDVSLESKNDTIVFSLDSNNLQWDYADDPDFPVNQTTISLMISYIKELSYTRTINDVTDLGIYKLDNPVLKLSITVSDGTSHTLLISEPIADGDTFYFYEENNSKTVYLSSSKLDAYASYGIYDFMQLVTIPSFISHNINSVEFNPKNGEYVKIFYTLMDDNQTSMELGYITDKNFKMSTEEVNTLWHSNPESAEFDSFLPADGRDTGIMMNYINEFIINRAVKYKPSQQELESYGLLEPQTIVTLEFSDFPPYHIYVGNPISDNKAEYYVMVSCSGSGEIENQYNSSAVYTANSIYCEYYLKMCADNINGSNSRKTFKDEEIPNITADNLDHLNITINTFSEETGEQISEGVLGIYYDDTYSLQIKSYLYVLSGSDDKPNEEVILPPQPVSNAAAKQFFEYISSSNQFKYTETVVKNLSSDLEKYPENAVVFDQYGLLKPIKDFQFDLGFDELWTLSIGTDGSEYYVRASNSECIYKMSDSMISYLMALDKDILTGEKVYGQIEDNSIN